MSIKSLGFEGSVNGPFPVKYMFYTNTFSLYIKKLIFSSLLGLEKTDS
jgi:hypothetical protein